MPVTASGGSTANTGGHRPRDHGAGGHAEERRQGVCQHQDHDLQLCVQVGGHPGTHVVIHSSIYMVIYIYQ